MSEQQLQSVAEEVVRLAHRQGYVVEREVREELARAGVADSRRKDVLALAQPTLSYRRGRYHYDAPLGERDAATQPRNDIQAAVGRLVRLYGSSPGRVERREQGRVDFIQAVQVVTEDNRTFTLLT